MRLFAYSYRSGLIGFGIKLPKGCLIIAKGEDEEILREVVAGNARHGYPPDNELLVPGIPEAPDENSALMAHAQFSARICKALKLRGL